jgi:hypothetical protein
MTVDDLTVAIARWIAPEDRCHDAARCLSRGNCACLGRGRRMATALWPLVELHAREAAARRVGTIVVESADPGRRAWRIT